MRTIFFALCMVFGAVAYGKSLSTTELKKLQSELRSHNYLSVQFTQSNFSGLRKKTPRTTSGKALFAKPDKFRWSDENSELVYNGKDLYQYNPAEKVATKFSELANTSKNIHQITEMVLDVEKLFDTYDVSKSEVDKGVVSLQLKPKKTTDVSTVDLEISDDRAYVKSIKITYKDANYLDVKFKNPRTTAISAEQFEFVAPPGVTISTVK